LLVEGGLVSSSVTATFVFTDLVDSTATAARLGPEAAEALRQTHFRLLRGAVLASGGTEVKNLGDGLMVMFSSPSRALAGAVGMQQAIEHHNRSGDQQLAVRIGISAGEAVEEDGDYFGDPVVEAARLCAAADGGQILAAELVRLMVGRHATQTFVAVGPMALKGIPEPVDTVEVLWEPAKVAGSVPLPGRLVGAAADALLGFFGRGPELAALHAASKQARATQRCQAVFVAGEAGMGKTALTAQVARTAHSEGAIVLFGHADEDLGVAYQPWIEVLSTLVRDGAPELVAGLRPAQRAALARLVPDAGGDTDRVADPDTERSCCWRRPASSSPRHRKARR
jgi:class 3 adenylate cyclase